MNGLLVLITQALLRSFIASYLLEASVLGSDSLIPYGESIVKACPFAGGDNSSVYGHLVDSDHVDVYVGVSRMATQLKGSYIVHYQNASWMWTDKGSVDNGWRNHFLEHGWYEGYSTGYPSTEWKYFSRTVGNTSAIPLVPYGCWFHLSPDSNAFVKVGNAFMYQKRNRTICTRLGLTTDGCIKGQPARHCSDKYWCTAALGLGYDSILSFENHEIITCGGECGTLPLGGACPPIRLYQDYRASEDCHCSDDPFQPCTKKELHALRLSDCSYFNCGYLDSTGQKRDTYQYLVNTDNQAINPKSIRDGKCIMEGPIVEPPLSYSLDIIFTSNLLADQLLVETVVQRLIVADGRSVVILNMERRPDLSFGFGRNENDMGASRAAIDAFLDASPLHVRLVGHHVQKHRSGSSRHSSDLVVHLYTNMAGFKNPTLLKIGNVTIGIIVHESIVLRQETISMRELLVWIIKESACLRRLGAERVVVMSDVGWDMHHELLAHASKHVDLFLSANSTGLVHECRRSDQVKAVLQIPLYDNNNNNNTSKRPAVGLVQWRKPYDPIESPFQMKCTIE